MTQLTFNANYSFCGCSAACRFLTSHDPKWMTADAHLSGNHGDSTKVNFKKTGNFVKGRQIRSTLTYASFRTEDSRTRAHSQSLSSICLHFLSLTLSSSLPPLSVTLFVLSLSPSLPLLSLPLSPFPCSFSHSLFPVSLSSRFSSRPSILYSPSPPPRAGILPV